MAKKKTAKKTPTRAASTKGRRVSTSKKIAKKRAPKRTPAQLRAEKEKLAYERALKRREAEKKRKAKLRAEAKRLAREEEIRQAQARLEELRKKKERSQKKAKREKALERMLDTAQALQRLARFTTQVHHPGDVAFARNADGSADVQLRLYGWPVGRKKLRDAYEDWSTQATEVAEFGKLPPEVRLQFDFGADPRFAGVNRYLKYRGNLPSTRTGHYVPTNPALLIGGDKLVKVFNSNGWRLKRLALNLRYDPRRSPEARAKARKERSKAPKLPPRTHDESERLRRERNALREQKDFIDYIGPKKTSKRGKKR